METILQAFSIAAISLSILLFFGPIIVITTLIGFLKIGPLLIDLRNLSKGVRILLGVIGLSIWMLIYIPLLSLSLRTIQPQGEVAVNGSIGTPNSTATS